MAHRLRWLPIVVLAVAPAVAVAGPKPQKGQTTKTQPLPSGDVSKQTPTDGPTPHVVLDEAAARKLAKSKPLPNGAALDVARAAGLDVEASDIKSPVTLTPRRPFHNTYTRLEAYGRIAFNPGEANRGVITIPPSRIGVGKITERIPRDEWQRRTDPYHPDFDGTATIEDDYLVIQFRAARSTAYVVSCNVTGREVFGAVVETNGTYDSWHPMSEDGGRVSFAITAKPGRPVVRVKLAAADANTGSAGFESLATVFGALGSGPWSVNRCRIVPVDVR